MIWRLLPLFLLILSLGAPARAQPPCGGTDLLAQRPEAERQAIEAAVAAAPFSQGLFWQAEREGARVTLVGTYHLADPRHAALVEKLRPELEKAALLLVEADAAAEDSLAEAAVERPELLFLTEGPSLLQQLPKEEWQRLAEAAKRRGIPAFMAAKYRPWLLAVMLGFAECGAMPAAEAARAGLDHQLMAAAEQAGLPQASIEPYDTLFQLFDVLPDEAELDILRSALMMEPLQEDLAFTLAEAYFAGRPYLIWELTRALSADPAYLLPGQSAADSLADFALFGDLLITRRNAAWIPVIEELASRGPIFVAVGALHLPGEDGVLALLQARGWTITPLAL